MRKEYDLSKMEGRKNPYADDLKAQVTIRLDKDTIAYFKELSKRTGTPYQVLINSYLRQCVAEKKEPKVAGNRAQKLPTPGPAALITRPRPFEVEFTRMSAGT